jgi:hypothetical protein
MKQKQKPILVFISSHEMHPQIANDLIGYDVRHIARRFYNVPQIFENIELVCGDVRPKVIMATLPKHWIVPFIQSVRAKWVTPGVAIVRPVMYGERFLGRYELRSVDKGGVLHQIPWIPQGSDLDKQMQAESRERAAGYKNLLDRLEGL